MWPTPTGPPGGNLNRLHASNRHMQRSRQVDRLPKPRLIETILELLHQDLETQFAGAVAGRDALDLELVVERRRDPLHLLHWRYHEMKAAGDGIKLRIDRGGILEDFV